MRLRTINEAIASEWTQIDSGTEAKVYTDGKFAYRVVGNYGPEDFKYLNRKVEPHINKTYPNVVKIFGISRDSSDVTIKMELLSKIDLSTVDSEEYKQVSGEISSCQDQIDNLPAIIDKIEDPEIKRMVQAMYDGGRQWGLQTMDLGFHNLMFDENTAEYKLIDLF